MRLDHLLSREYNKSDQIDHGFGQRRKQIRSLSELHCIVLRVLETVLSKGQKDEGRDHRGGVAQLGEHLLCKQGVIGSNPFISTNFTLGKGSAAHELRFPAEKRPGYEATWAHSSAG